jgi:UDP-glucuronate 4-epimerase
MKNILVTGGAGFIGSHLIDELLQKDFNIICLDNFDAFYAEEIKLQNIHNANQLSNFKLVRGDIRNENLLTKIFKENQIDVVIHLAGKAGVRPSIDQPKEYFDVNVNGTLCLLEVMREHHVKKLVFASSSSVYGNNSKIPYAENDVVDFPISPYAASKKSCELLTHTFHHLYEFDVLNLRFFTVFGPRQRPDLAIHKFFKAIYANQPIKVFGDGSTSRDYTFVSDTVDGIIAALNYVLQNKNVYDIINLGNHQPVELKTLIENIETCTHKQFVKEYLPMQPGDVNQTYASINKAFEILNYTPKKTIKEGLNLFNEWYLNTQIHE